jgi:uncharacterized membrane protein
MRNLLLVFITSAVPVIEQRGAIPVGILAYGIDPWTVFFVSLLGSMLPFPFIYFFIRPVFEFIKQKTRLGKLVEKIEKRTLAKSGQIVKYEAWGLMLFVGVPLPGTGIWTGTLAAVLLNMKLKYAFPAVLGGAVISAILITLGVTGAISIF